MRISYLPVHTTSRRVRSWFYAGLVILFTVLVAIQPTYALANEQMNVYRNGVNYFNVDEDAACNLSGSGSTPLSGSDNTEKAFNFFIGKGLSPVQTAGVIGNLLKESGMDPSINEKSGGGGFGIAQWTDPGRQQALNNLAKQQNLPVTTLSVQLDFIWVEFQGQFKSAYTHLKGATAVENATSIVMNEYEMPLERVQNLIDRTKLANKALERYGSTGAVVSAGNYTGSMCNGGGPGAVAGNIVQTALNYAWNTKGHGYLESDAKPSYRTDMPKYNGATDTFPYSDCGVFVATVMVASGADKDFVKRGTTLQMNYMSSHPEKYQEIPSVTSTAQLLPGDILVNSEHTYIYVGKQPNGFNSVAASLHTDNNVGHVPQPDNYYGGFRAFRLITNTSQGGTQ